MKKLLILDLDNTLYDWFNSYVPAFYKMIEFASVESGVPQEQLIKGMKRIHKQIQSPEYPEGIYQLLPIHLCWDILDVFYIEEASLLRLYDGVRGTLDRLQEGGIKIVAYSDSRSSVIFHKLYMHGLMRYFSDFYLAEDRCGNSYGNYSNLHQIPCSEYKPSGAVLETILEHNDCTVDDALVVGDSLYRDIYPANMLGVESAWAKYGVVENEELTKKLIAISHWNQEKIDSYNAKESVDSELMKPTYTLEKFSDLLEVLK